MTSDGAGTGGTTGRQEVEPETVTFESQGVRCEADLYLPPSREPPHPTVVMAHVFGAERSWGLGRFAKAFARAGIAAVPFDYRCFGTSGGEPRRLIDPARQLADWRAALAHVRSMAVVDPDRIAIWGTSFSGGHVLATASREPDVRAVVSMVPFVDGRAVIAHQTDHLGAIEQVGTLGSALADRLLGAVGRGPLELPIVSEPHGGGLVDTPGAESGFLSLLPEGVEVVNRTPARVLLDLPFYRPGVAPASIDVPVHVVIAEEDRLLPLGPMERLVERLPDGSVHRVPNAAHFDVHLDPWFEGVVQRQVAFLSTTLATDA